MKLVIKLKEGLALTQDWGQDFTHNGDLLQSIKTGKENNARLELVDVDGNPMERTWEDVYSLELILD